MSFPPIDAATTYSAHAPELEVLGSKQTRARHRHEGKGCKFIKAGGRVLYRGADVLAYLEACTIETEAA